MSKTDNPTARIGRFQIIVEHGRDGIARIATANDVESGKMVTLDILDEGSSDERDEVIKRARHCRPFVDRTIYGIVDILDSEQPPLIVREHERGMSLGQNVETDGPYEPHEAGRLIAQLARVLDRAHARGIVHGRMSIELIRQADPDGPFRIAGFGRPLGALNTPGIHPERLRYAAPEQIRGETATDRSDLYALGLIFYCLLAGRPAYEAKDQMLLAAQAGEGDMADLGEIAPHVPNEFRELVAKLTAFDPQERFRTGNALAEAIERVLAKTRPVAIPSQSTVSDQPVKEARRRMPVYWPGRLLLAASILMAATAGYFVWQEREQQPVRNTVSRPTTPQPEPVEAEDTKSSVPIAPSEETEVAAVVDEQTIDAVDDWQTVAAQARLEGCTQIEWVRGAQSLTLDGIIDDPTRLIELDGKLRAADVDTNSWTRLPHESASCAFLETLLPLTAQPAQRLIRLHIGGTPARATVGDLLVLDIDAPLEAPASGLWHVHAGYLTTDGHIIHLTQGAHTVEPLEPGSAIRIGEPSKGEWFRLAAPGGVEVAFALLTSTAIPHPSDRIEKADQAAVRMAQDLADMASPALFSVMPITIEQR